MNEGLASVSAEETFQRAEIHRLSSRRNRPHIKSPPRPHRRRPLPRLAGSSSP